MPDILILDDTFRAFHALLHRAVKRVISWHLEEAEFGILGCEKSGPYANNSVQRMCNFSGSIKITKMSVVK